MMTALTPNRGWPLPNNGSATGGVNLADDIGNLIDAFLAADVDVQGVISGLAAKVDAVSPALSGTPTAPTAPSGDDSTTIANTAFVVLAVSTAIANLVASSPATLDTLNELAAALGDDPNFATTVATQLGLKANSADVYLKTAVNTLLAAKASLTGTETLTNKTLTNPVINGPVPAAQQSITASVASNALTLVIDPNVLDFRASTLSSGTPTRETLASALSLTVPSGATLGTTNGVSARLVLLELKDGSTLRPGVVNLAGGVSLDETGLISATAISAGATSISTVYSNANVANAPYRVVGFVDVTEAAAGAWATAPSLVQGAGGQAASGMASLGHGQKWQSVTRVSGTTYFNTTGRPITLKTYINTGASNSGSAQVTFADGTVVTYAANFVSGGSICVGDIIIPAGASYTPVFANAASLSNWELR